MLLQFWNQNVESARYLNLNGDFPLRGDRCPTSSPVHHHRSQTGKKGVGHYHLRLQMKSLRDLAWDHIMWPVEFTWRNVWVGVEPPGKRILRLHCRWLTVGVVNDPSSSFKPSPRSKMQTFTSCKDWPLSFLNDLKTSKCKVLERPTQSQDLKQVVRAQKPL